MPNQDTSFQIERVDIQITSVGLNPTMYISTMHSMAYSFHHNMVFQPISNVINGLTLSDIMYFEQAGISINCSDEFDMLTTQVFD